MLLHQQKNDVQWLAQIEIAGLVANAFQQYVDDFYTLYAYVIMPNHVHVLFQPLVDAKSELPIPLRVITQRLKGATARAANLLLGRTGKSFWARKLYDHWSRDEQETARIVNYIVNNPVKAGLVDDFEDWAWAWVNKSLFE